MFSTEIRRMKIFRVSKICSTLRDWPKQAADRVYLELRRSPRTAVQCSVYTYRVVIDIRVPSSFAVRAGVRNCHRAPVNTHRNRVAGGVYAAAVSYDGRTYTQRTRKLGSLSYTKVADTLRGSAYAGLAASWILSIRSTWRIRGRPARWRFPSPTAAASDRGGRGFGPPVRGRNRPVYNAGPADRRRQSIR